MNLGERKLKILKALVETYVATGEPVGSKALCEALDFPVSSATIRNEMAELSEMGLLEQPHTSAGRVPSHLGYRLYINRLMQPKPLAEEERQYMDSVLNTAADDPERLLGNASQMLARLTKMAAVSTSPTDEDATVRNIELVQTGRRSGMVMLMTSFGMVKMRPFRCDYDLTPEILRVFYRLINQKLRGLQLSSITPAFIQSMAAALGDTFMLLPDVLMAVLEAAKDALAADIRLEGETNLLFFPESELFSARRVIEFLNNRRELGHLLLNQNGSLKVLIGKENEQPELKESSIVVARYSLAGNQAGAIGVIGPTRMDYARMLTNLEYLARSVGNLLSEILDIE